MRKNYVPGILTATSFFAEGSLQLSGYQNIPLAWILGLLAVSSTIYAALICYRGHAGPVGDLLSWRQWFLLPFGRRLSLREAANRAYEKLEDCKPFWTLAADELGQIFPKKESRQESALNWFTDYLATKKSPSLESIRHLGLKDWLILLNFRAVNSRKILSTTHIRMSRNIQILE